MNGPNKRYQNPNPGTAFLRAINERAAKELHNDIIQAHCDGYDEPEYAQLDVIRKHVANISKLQNPGEDYVGITTPFYCHHNGLFLLHKRSKNCRDEVGRWDPGSGQLEHGLTLEENVLKEVKEEYGVDGVIDHRLPAHSIFREDKNKLPGFRQTHWLAIPFFVSVDPTKARINEPDKMDEFGWFSLGSLPRPLHTGFAYTLEKYREQFDDFVKRFRGTATTG